MTALPFLDLPPLLGVSGTVRLPGSKSISNRVLLLAGTGSLPLIVAFTLLMGASQGVITIVRGAVPLVLFGAKGYGAVLGVIATPILIVNAASPTVFAWIVDRWGWATGRVSLLVGCSAAWIAMELMSRWYERRRAVAVGTDSALRR